MGRELKRVPLDFDWPLHKIWEGFICPHDERPCPKKASGECHDGYSSSGKWLDAISRLIALVGQEAVSEPRAKELRLRGQLYPHPYLTHWEQAPHGDDNGDGRLLPFGSELITFVQGLAKDCDIGTLSGSMTSWEISKTLLKAAGIEDEKWGLCKVCGGTCVHPDDQKADDDDEEWEPTEPPVGDGYQLWETVSEGSPISPVFPTEEKFVEYLVREDGYSEGAAKSFVKTGWVPSAMMVTNGPDAGFYENIEAAPLLEKGTLEKGPRTPGRP